MKMHRAMAASLAMALFCGSGCSPDPGGTGAGSAAAPAAAGPHGQALAALQSPPQAFAVSADVHASYRIGDELRFEVRSAESGDLHVVQVDQGDAVSVLLPNAAIAGNRIEAGKPFLFPPPESGVRILAEGPAGASLLAFVVTRDGQPLEAVLPALFAQQPSQAQPQPPPQQPASTRGLTLQDGPPPPAATGASWSFARYTIRVEDASR